MTQELQTPAAQTHSVLRLQAPEPFTCTICQSEQIPPSGPDGLWSCGLCGQVYFGHAEPGIVMSDAQIAALRQQAGRDPSGKSTIVPNWWTQNDQPVGKDFLAWNDAAPARQYTRKLITDWAAAGEVKSVLEIAFGGLHEFRALREPLGALGVRYSGVDWTAHFVAHAQKEFPQNQWTQGDIVRGVNVEPADLVYSQHMLEHIPALEPAFSNMLRLAKRKLINIFFIPPKAFAGYEVVNWQQYPLYHNTYSVGHVEAVCRAMGFRHQWATFGEDVVLVAERITPA
jgi:SAM-dependent methyltransferase